MKKIPTIYVRDWDGVYGPKGRLVTRDPHPDAAWVFAGEGIPTRKLDGTAMAVIGGELHKRLALPEGRIKPDGFVPLEWEGEDVKRKLIGWVPVGDGPEDRWAREALAIGPAATADGTYELVGPRVQGNPEGTPSHELVSHDRLEIAEDVPTGFDDLIDWLETRDVEGIVWHHPDGRMGKIKKKDFGLARTPAAANAR